jgi:transcriptional regulator with XRE-family HTH domain
MAAGHDPDRPALALFAAELRAARQHAGLTRDELSAKVNYSPSLIGMIETGRRVPSRDLAERLDEVFGPDRGTFARLETGLRDLPYPASFRPFSTYEAEARSLRLFEHVLVPGLLQTPSYARAVLATRPHTSADEIDELVTARQTLLARADLPLLYVLLDEGVLHRPVAPPDVMAEQLVRLAELSEEALRHPAGDPVHRWRAHRTARRVRHRRAARFARYRVPGLRSRRPDRGRRGDSVASDTALRRPPRRGSAASCVPGHDQESC